VKCQEVMERDPRDGVQEAAEERARVVAEAGWGALAWDWEAIAFAQTVAIRFPIKGACPA
jgi:hypothetical protein